MAETLRLDKWLWFARLAKTRGIAQAMCQSRHVRLDGRVVERAAATVRPGQILVLPTASAVRVLRVLALPARRGPFSEACRSYEDIALPLERRSGIDAWPPQSLGASTESELHRGSHP